MADTPKSRELLAASDRARSLLDTMGQDLINSLPATVQPKRFKAAFVNLAVHNPSIFTCTADSLRSSLLKCAVDGLVPDGRLAAIVAFKTKTPDGKWLSIAQYIPMYQGLISRARELGETFSVTANVVYQNDVFDVDEADPQQTTHKRPPLNQDRGQIVGAYAIFRTEGGKVIHREVMDLKELMKVQNMSRAKEGPWKTWPDQMMRKTPIRRGSKYIPMSAELRQIIERDDEFNPPEDNGADDETNYNPLTGKTAGKVIELRPTPTAETSPVTPGMTEKSEQSRPTVEEPSSGGAAPTEEVIADDGGNPPAPQAELGLEQPAPAKEKPVAQAKPPAKPPAAKSAMPPRDYAVKLLHEYTNALSALVTAADVTKRSSDFWNAVDSGFPEGNKLGNYAGEIFEAQMARVQGKGSPAEVDAVVKKFVAERAW